MFYFYVVIGAFEIFIATVAAIQLTKTIANSARIAIDCCLKYRESKRLVKRPSALFK